MMKTFTLAFASVVGGLSVVAGAFGVHALKKILSPDKLVSFDTGVKYQIYHALALMIIGIYLDFEKKIDHTIVWLMMGGIVLFSGSIYFLSLSDNFKFLGPVTPIGGTFLIISWFLLAYRFMIS